MFCEAYRKPLTDAAAAGSVNERTLQSHLAHCEACAAAFAREQALFAAMDGGLSHLVNAEAPPSLLPRVREALSRELVSSPTLRTGWFWMPAASVASLMLAALLPRVFPPSPGADPAVLVQPSSPPYGTSSNSAPSGRPERRAPAPRRALALQAARSARARPEVLVPAGGQAALLKYAVLLQNQSELAHSLTQREEQKPLAIEPLEIAALEAQEIQIEPLVRDSEDVSR